MCSFVGRKIIKDMNRRELIKSLLAVGAISSLPKALKPSVKEQNHYHIVGLGTASAKVMQHFYNKGFKAKYSHICCDDESFYQGNSIKIDRDLFLEQYGVFLDSLNLPSALNGFFNTDENYILLAPLGGVSGSYLFRTIYNHLKNKQISCKVLASYPFHFEGSRRVKRASQVSQYAKLGSDFHSFDLEQKKLEWGNQAIREAFNLADEEMYRKLIAMV